MLNHLLTYLKYEEQLIKELIGLASKQQNALITFSFSELEECGKYQIDVLSKLRKAEENRVSILVNWLKIPRKDAINMTMSDLEMKFKNEELADIGQIKANMKLLLDELNEINLTNKILSIRAKHSVNNILQIVTNGRNHIYSKKV